MILNLLQSEAKFIDGGQHYLTILPHRDGENGYWKHVTLVTAPVSSISIEYQHLSTINVPVKLLKAMSLHQTSYDFISYHIFLFA